MENINCRRLKEKLLCKTLEIESVKAKANEEIRQYKEKANYLLKLLNTAYQERDEARNQLQKLIIINNDDNNNIIFSDAVLSTELSNGSISLVDSFDCDRENIDPGYVLIEQVVKGKSLPENGKLLQAVMDAGPLLQTLLVEPPLPQWRNPPPALTSFEVQRPVIHSMQVLDKSSAYSQILHTRSTSY